MNYTKQIAKIFGVQPGEAFRLTGYKGVFRITKAGLEEKFRNITWIPAVDRMFHEIITGMTEIVKLEDET